MAVVPSASSMVIKALKEPPRDRKKVKNVPHDGDITFEDVYAIAKTMRERSMSRKMCVVLLSPSPAPFSSSSPFSCSSCHPLALVSLFLDRVFKALDDLIV